MPDQATPVRRIEPDFQPLGFQRYPSGFTRYFLRVRGEVCAFIARDMRCFSFLMDIYPYAGHWAQQFPGRCRLKVDTSEAAGWFIRRCRDAGPYDPPEHLRPRPKGRPIGWRKPAKPEP